MHISQLADRFVRDPSEIVKVGQTVTVSVLEVDLERKRIALSMRLADEAPRKAAEGEPGSRPQRGKAAQGKARQRQQPARPAPVTAMSQAFARLAEKQ